MKDNTTKFTSAFPMSPLIVIITTLYNLLILSMVYNAFRSSIIILEIISLVFLISPSFFIPLRLVVTEKNLRIWRPIGKVEIPLENIKSCTIIEDCRSIIDNTIRTQTMLPPPIERRAALYHQFAEAGGDCGVYFPTHQISQIFVFSNKRILFFCNFAA